MNKLAENVQNISVVLAKKDFIKLKNLGHKYKKTVSELVREAIDDYFLKTGIKKKVQKNNFFNKPAN